MKSLLLAILVIASTQHNCGFYYNKPKATFPHKDPTARFGTKIIKGQNGKNYEVTMMAPKRVYERRVSPTEHVVLVEHVNQPTAELNANSQHLFTARNQQPNARWQPPHGRTVLIISQAQRKQQGGAFFPQPSARIPQSILQPPQLNNNPLNSPGHVFQTEASQLRVQPHNQIGSSPQETARIPKIILQPPFGNNKPTIIPRYISQSEASQLDVYPYKQINGNPRPFTRIINICDALGRCKPQNAANGLIGGNDFYHQQYLKQTKVNFEPKDNKCQNKIKKEFMGYVLPNNNATFINEKKRMKGRRLFPYREVVIPQYPYN